MKWFRARSMLYDSRFNSVEVKGLRYRNTTLNVRLSFEEKTLCRVLQTHLFSFNSALLFCFITSGYNRGDPENIY